MKNTSLINRLASYSLASISFVLIHEPVNGEVIYTDLEPDIILPGPNDLYPFDIDNSGSNELRFYNFSFAYYNYTNFSYRTRQAIMIDSMYDGVYVAALADWTYYSGIIKYASALVAGVLIDEYDHWYKMDNPVDNFAMAALTFTNVGAGTGTDSCNNCYWYNESISETVNGFLAVKFKIEDNFHYGWIRCDVLDEGRTLVIKDYAYEDEPNNPIVAGDTTHYVSINSLLNTMDATVYSFGRDIYILTETFQNNEVVIYDLNGKQIISEVLQSKSESISMTNYPAGIYLVTLLNDGKRFDKKVFIE
ncbi:MAG: T9SS type A sorting domain-containing protein [Bacteroidetes bacterium]|nr:T9SS type A sorting domain-containing protein [Bacteroidota bacterium]